MHYIEYEGKITCCKNSKWFSETCTA